ncbi:MAG: pyrroline-5-carboxylate reductase [Clostridiales bacterium]|nr:pyrroline-5-carboxylate reductase [Candidatus Apopatocola equi]MCQ2439740.1 pyrroline-5-carboxylate reductase [Oscillospiraceae bacterium]
MAKLGFIGTGNMGGALAKAASKVHSNELFLTNRHAEKAIRLAAELGGRVCSNAEAAGCDYIILGVKPRGMGELLRSLREILEQRKRRRESFVIVSMATGTSIKQVQNWAGDIYPVIRIMPNTPVAIGEGTILYACSEQVTEEQKRGFLEAMAESGLFVPLHESLIDAGSAVSGCGPAFVCMFLEAMADGAVACGLSREDALRLSAQTMAGTAKYLLETGKHPGEVKDGVCSPGGTTIQGVRRLEEGGVRADIMDAVIAAYEKNSSI